MGDTGSLLLGGVVSCSAIYLKMPLLILIIAAVPVLETLSVIIQVAYYKRTKKRIFIIKSYSASLRCKFNRY